MEDSRANIEDTGPCRVLLLSSNRVTSPYPVFPLGVAFLEAALLKAGHAVRVWDALVHGEGELDSGLEWAQAVGLSMRNVDNVSASQPEAYVEETAAFIAKIRARRNLPLLIGGAAFSIFPEEILRYFGLAWGVRSEGEGAIVQWLEMLAGLREAETIPGLVYWRDGQVVSNPPQALACESIPRIEPSLDWVRAYVAMGGMLSVQTQRGCAFRCTYCTYPLIEGRCYRHRDPQDIAAEFAWLKQGGVRYVFFTDSVFNTDPRHVAAICEALVKASTGIQWGCFARPQKLTDELLELMVAAGLQHIEFGSDSFCDVTLRSYGKSFRFEDILETSEMVARHKVHACHYVIFGGPGETAQTIGETIANAARLPPAPIFAFSGMRIYPGTPLYQQTGCQLDFHTLLQPHFYENPQFTTEEVRSLIAAGTAGLSHWIIGDHADDHAMATNALRLRGKQGPLWEYLDLMRRMSATDSSTKLTQS